MTDNQYQQQLQRNRMMAQTAEQVANKTVRVGVDIFRALLKFLQEMIAQALGK